MSRAPRATHAWRHGACGRACVAAHARTARRRAYSLPVPHEGARLQNAACSLVLRFLGGRATARAAGAARVAPCRRALRAPRKSHQSSGQILCAPSLPRISTHTITKLPEIGRWVPGGPVFAVTGCAQTPRLHSDVEEFARAKLPLPLSRPSASDGATQR